MLNSALWAGMAYDDSTLTIGEFSVLQKDKWIDYVQFKRNLHLEKGFESKELTTVKWFSQGLYFLELKDSATLNVYVVKWGRTDFSKTAPGEAFIFYYQVQKAHGKFHLKAVKPEFTWDMFKMAINQLWNRIWSK